MSGVGAFLRSFDGHVKLVHDARVRTYSGALVTLCAVTIIVTLCASEVSIFMEPHVREHLRVDFGKSKKMKIDFDIEFPHIPCSLLSLDAMDVSGSHQDDLTHHIKKTPLGKDGKPVGKATKGLVAEGLTMEKGEFSRTPEEHTAAKDKAADPDYCGSCYGTETEEHPCCNTCADVRAQYRAKGWALDDLKIIEQCAREGTTNEEFKAQLERGEGCQLKGYLYVNKVAGNFHVAPGKSFQHAHRHTHDLAAFEAGVFNISHRINKVSYGRSYPGAVNPLDGVERNVEEGGGMYMYYTKVVPTRYKYLRGAVLATNQYSVTEHFRKPLKEERRAKHGLPGVFFFYELSPIMVDVIEEHKSIMYLVTQICAILAGVFTVAGLFDKLVFHGVRTIEKKMQVGKLA